MHCTNMEAVEHVYFENIVQLRGGRCLFAIKFLLNERRTEKAVLQCIIFCVFHDRKITIVLHLR